MKNFKRKPPVMHKIRIHSDIPVSGDQIDFVLSPPAKTPLLIIYKSSGKFHFPNYQFVNLSGLILRIVRQLNFLLIFYNYYIDIYNNLTIFGP